MAFTPADRAAAQAGSNTPADSAACCDSDIAVPEPPITRFISARGHRIVLEQTKLDQVQTWLGPGKVIETGDASEYLARLCYEGSEGGRPLYVVFESDETGGGTIDIVELCRSGLRPEACVPCSRLPAGSGRMTFARGLTIGATKRRVLALLGPAQSDSGASLHYAHVRTWKEQSQWLGAVRGELDEVNEYSTLDLLFERDTLVWIRAHKVTSD